MWVAKARSCDLDELQFFLCETVSDDNEESGMLLLDVPSLRLSIQTAAVCKVCNGDLTFLEDPVKKLRLFT